MPSSASVSNIRAATPAWLRMPSPTIETLAMSLVGLDAARRRARARPASTSASALSEVGLRHGEGQVGRAVGAGVLDDHVDDDVGVGDGAEDARREARAGPGTPQQRDLRLVAVEATPETRTSSMLASSSTTQVPGLVEARAHVHAARRSASRTRPSGSAAPWRRGSRARASPRSRCARACARAGRCAGRWCRRRRRRCRSRRRRRSSAAASATALVSEPPRPSVVMLPSSSTPWKPATTATLAGVERGADAARRRCSGCAPCRRRCRWRCGPGGRGTTRAGQPPCAEGDREERRR